MGLEGVEIVMATEQEFGIEIADEEAEKVLTVGDLCALVIKKLHGIPLEYCRSANAFYRLRKYMVEFLGIPRNCITLDREMNDIMPRENRREIYQNMGRDLSLRLPELVRPHSMERFFERLTVLYLFVAFGCILILISKFAAGIMRFHIFDLWLTYLIVGSLAILPLPLISLITQKFAIHFPASCSTVRNMIQEIVSKNYGSADVWNETTDKKEVQDRVRAIIAEQLVMELEKVTLDAEFVKDLGC